MVKVIVGLVAGMALTMILAWNMAGSLMFNEVQSPFGLEENRGPASSTTSRRTRNSRPRAGPCPACATRPRRCRRMAAMCCRS